MQTAQYIRSSLGAPVRLPDVTAVPAAGPRSAEFGATAFGRNGIETVEGSSAYEAFCVEMAKFFKTGKPPVSLDETIEIFAFMEAADESKRRAGKPVTLASVLEKAGEEAKQRIAELDQ